MAPLVPLSSSVVSACTHAPQEGSVIKGLWWCAQRVQEVQKVWLVQAVQPVQASNLSFASWGRNRRALALFKGY